MADVHTYYDISPWSPDGRYMVFSAANPKDITAVHRDTLATCKGQLYLMDLETYELRLLARERILQHPHRRLPRLASDQM